MNLLEIIRERNISILQVAMRSGVTPSDFYSALNGKKPFYPAWKRRIAAYLGIDEQELFEDVENHD